MSYLTVALIGVISAVAFLRQKNNSCKYKISLKHRSNSNVG